MRKPRLVYLLISVVLLVTILMGCNSSGQTKLSSSDSSEGQSDNEKVTLSYWVPFGVNESGITSYAENSMYIELQKRLNIKLNFVHPPAGQETEQFNLMIASEDYTDIIEGAERYKGGIDKAIGDNVYIKLNSLAEKYAPDYMKVINSNEKLKRQVYSDNGNLLGFGCITSPAEGDSLEVGVETPWCGSFIRKDWLDELNLEVPTTIDEWDKVLKAFKENKNAEVPMLWNTSNGFIWTGGFLTAFDNAPDFFNKNGEIKYGFIEPGYKEYLALLNKWYKEGLIDKEFPSRDSKSVKALYMGGKAGAILSGGTAIMTEGEAVGLKFVGTPFPKKDDNTDIHWVSKNNICRDMYAVVTTKCKIPEEAIKFLNYGYTLEGFRLYNFGVEGVSYTSIDEKGRPVYIDKYTKDNYMDFDRYHPAFRRHGGSFLYSGERAVPRMWMEDHLAIRKVWQNQPSDYKLPPITLTDKEGKEYASIMSDINSYRDEETLKFIMGDRPLTEFDDYVKRIKDMNIDRVIEMYKDAYDRYNNRLNKIE